MARPRGYSTQGDVLVSKSGDGIDLNAIWDEIAQAAAVYNKHQTALVSLLSFRTTDPGAAVEQGASLPAYERATEFGVPKSIRQGTALPVGYDLQDYDLRWASSWKFLRAATAKQIKDLANTAMLADQKNITATVLNRLLDPAVSANENSTPIFGCWSGTGSMIPPTFMGKAFAANHQHYLVSGATSLDSEDIEVLSNHVTEHGYGRDAGSRLLILCGPNEADVIASFRAGQTNNNSKVAKHDFIPSSAAPPYLTDQTLVGDRAPDNLGGVPITGSYGRAWVAETPLMPDGYVAAVVTNGANSALNPIGFREWPAPEYRGLRLIPGVGPYPLQDSFYQRSFGVGVRHRGAAAILQLKASGSYDTPTVSV
ncbi:hypothetical protein [Mycolicibacterium diernhoferi]|nr:hypothetical protein [Mycolicibacterium diernhoferi]